MVLNGDKLVCELTEVGGKLFTAHNLCHIMRDQADMIPIADITHVTLTSVDDLGHENDLTTTG